MPLIPIYLTWHNNNIKKPKGCFELQSSPVLTPPQSNNNFTKQSPIFPVNKDHIFVNNLSLKKIKKIFFIYSNNTLNDISLLSTKYEKNIFFSHGLASIIVFTTDNNFNTKFKKIFDSSIANIYAYEIFSLDNGEIKNSKPIFPTPHSYNVNDYTINANTNNTTSDKEAKALLSDENFILDEIQLNINSALSISSLYRPDLLNNIKEFVKEINITIGRLVKARSELANTGYSLESYQKINLYSDWIMQGNSAISYYKSQAFSGTIPLLTGTHNHIEKYSLLGIGNTHKAACNFLFFCLKHFRRFSLHDILTGNYGEINGVPSNIILRNYEKEFTNVDPSQYNIAISKFIHDTGKSHSNKLIYYSGRLGFSEIKHAITCALQTINSADTAKWSIITLTHELMHAHVSEIISGLFAGKVEEFNDKTWEQYYLEYYNELSSSKTSNNGLRKTLRLVIINYLIYTETRFNPIDKKFTIQIPTTGIELKLLFKKHFKFLQEIIVHVLDFYYFYDSDNEKYIYSLWHSWNGIPSVFDNIELYILRSLSAISRIEEGSPNTRFWLSTSKLKSYLSDIITMAPDNVTAKKALSYLNDKQKTAKLSYLAVPSFYLADYIYNYLTVPDISDLISNFDDNIQEDEDGLIYDIPKCTFPGGEIKNPLFFVKDCLKPTPPNEDLFCEEYSSAWDLLLLASSITDLEE